MRTQPFYHVTAVDDVEQIMREGLKGGMTPRNRGEALTVPSVFVLTTKRTNVTDSIAIHQIWSDEDIERYAVLRISSTGVTGPVLHDQVAEYLAPLHRIIQQAVIEPRYLKLVNIRRLDFPGRKLAEIREAFLSRSLTSQEWTLARLYFDLAWIRGQEHYETETATAPSAKQTMSKSRSKKP